MNQMAARGMGEGGTLWASHPQILKSIKQTVFTQKSQNIVNILNFLYFNLAEIAKYRVVFFFLDQASNRGNSCGQDFPGGVTPSNFLMATCHPL